MSRSNTPLIIHNNVGNNKKKQMDINELIKNLVETYFKDLKGHINIILVVFFFLTIASQIIQTLYVTKTIERFKNKLKKAEIKFSKYNQLQIEALANLMDELSNFILQSLVIENLKEPGKSLEYSKEKISDWQSSYNDIFQLVLRKRFLYPKEVKNKTSELIETATELLEITKECSKYYDYFYTDHTGETQLEQDELFEEVNINYTKANVKNTSEKTVELVKETRIVIEDYFETME
jgi:hypothetical protein